MVRQSKLNALISMQINTFYFTQCSHWVIFFFFLHFNWICAPELCKRTICIQEDLNIFYWTAKKEKKNTTKQTFKTFLILSIATQLKSIWQNNNIDRLISIVRTLVNCIYLQTGFQRSRMKFQYWMKCSRALETNDRMLY